MLMHDNNRALESERKKTLPGLRSVHLFENDVERSWHSFKMTADTTFQYYDWSDWGLIVDDEDITASVRFSLMKEKYRIVSFGYLD